MLSHALAFSFFSTILLSFFSFFFTFIPPFPVPAVTLTGQKKKGGDDWDGRRGQRKERSMGLKYGKE